MSAGYYKQHRDILKLVRAGAIDLLILGIYCFLCLSANLVIGNGYPLPAGVVAISAVALNAHYRFVSVRTLQRALKRMEANGLLKFSPWRQTGKRGNYMVLLCRVSVHDMSGKEFKVNGEKTIDWRYPVYEAVGEVAGNCRPSVWEVSGYRELEKENREKKNLAAKPAPPADPRFQPFYSSSYEAYRRKYGQPPTWGGRDQRLLKRFLAAQPHITSEEFARRFRNYLDSTDEFTRTKGGSLAHFVTNFDAFRDGPILRRAPPCGLVAAGPTPARFKLSRESTTASPFSR